MNKWIAEFDLEDGDTMPEHMDLEYKGAKIDFHCKPLEQEPFINKPCVSSGVCEHDKNMVLDKIRAEIACSIIEDDTSENIPARLRADWAAANKAHLIDIAIIDRYKAEKEQNE